MALVSPGPSVAESLRAALNAARKGQQKDRILVLGTIIANLKNRELEDEFASANALYKILRSKHE